MDLDVLETFYWVATLKTQERAAGRLNIEPTTVQKRMRALQNELGPLFFKRKDGPSQLTRAGLQLLPEAERLLRLWRDVEARLKNDARTRPATTLLRIGVIESVLHTWLIPWLDCLKAERPELELALTVDTSASLLERLSEGRLDVAWTTLPSAAEGVQTRSFAPLAMVFAGKRSQHAKKRQTIEQLAEGELLTFQQGSLPDIALRELLRVAGIASPRLHGISSIAAMMMLVGNGFGVATLPLLAIRRLGPTSPIVALACSVALPALPIHASFYPDPSSRLVDEIVASAFAFVHGAAHEGIS